MAAFSLISLQQLALGAGCWCVLRQLTLIGPFADILHAADQSGLVIPKLRRTWFGLVRLYCTNRTMNINELNGFGTHVHQMHNELCKIHDLNKSLIFQLKALRCCHILEDAVSSFKIRLQL